jgi:hypothetical protein
MRHLVSFLLVSILALLCLGGCDSGEDFSGSTNGGPAGFREISGTLNVTRFHVPEGRLY